MLGRGTIREMNLSRGATREMEFRQRGDQRNGIYREGRSERKGQLGRGTARERDYYGEDDQRRLR